MLKKYNTTFEINEILNKVKKNPYNSTSKLKTQTQKSMGALG